MQKDEHRQHGGDNPRFLLRLDEGVIDSAFQSSMGHAGIDLLFDPGTAGSPITYRTRFGRQFVVVATGSGKDATLVAFALSSRSRDGTATGASFSSPPRPATRLPEE